MTRWIVDLTFVMFVCFSCGRAEISPSTEKAIVTHEQFTQAYGIVSKIDYLSFEYTRDGCYARALYMAMELASKEIPSSSMYAFQVSGDQPLQLEDGTRWNYHVAPMLKDGKDGEETVIDPAMKEGPYLPLKRWVSKMVYAGATPALARAQGSNYNSALAKGHMEDMISSITEMRPFKTSDIASACQTMYRYLGKEPQSGRGVDARRETLLNRTKGLLSELTVIDKLQPDSKSKSIACGGASFEIPQR